MQFDNQLDNQVDKSENFEAVDEITQKRLQRRKARKQKEMLSNIAFLSAVIFIVVAIAAIVLSGQADKEASAKPDKVKPTEQKITVPKPEITEDFLTVNPYSRPGDTLTEVKGVVVHYVGNPNTTAKQNRDYFEDLATTHATSASSHFVIGLDGEILQCMPLNEIAYASNKRNADTISIECCHPDETGKYNEKTYNTLVQLLAWLVCEYELEVDDVIRHYDVTGKECPKYFVENESAWDDLKLDVTEYIKSKNK